MIRMLTTLLLAAFTAGAAVVPRPSPDYPITLPDGRKINVSQYKGKVVALEFLLTTCPHCQRTSKLLGQLNAELGAKGFQPLGVAIDPNPDIRGFSRQWGVNYPIGVAPRESVYGYLQHSIMSPNLMMPQLVFIDRTGTIRAQYAGTDGFFNDEEKNVRAMLDKLLKEGSAPAAGKPSAAKRPRAAARKGSS